MGHERSSPWSECITIRARWVLCLLAVLSTLLISCKASQLLKAQEWSENYATLEGVTCTSPLMIDGDLNTVGDAGREIMMTFPERKSIHRIVLHGINFEDFIIYEGRLGEGNWQKIKTVNNNQLAEMELRVTATTDRLRFRIGGTFDDQRAAGQITPLTGRVVPQRKRARKRAAEIEIYGFRQTSPVDPPIEDVLSDEAMPDEDLPEVDIEDEPLF